MSPIYIINYCYELGNNTGRLEQRGSLITDESV